MGKHFGDGESKVTWGDLKAWAQGNQIGDDYEIWNDDGSFLNDLDCEPGEGADKPVLVTYFAT